MITKHCSTERSAWANSFAISMRISEIAYAIVLGWVNCADIIHQFFSLV